MKIKGIDAAVEKFNNWPATARIFFNTGTGRVNCETFVRPEEGRFIKSKSIREVFNKETLYGENITVSRETIHKLCIQEIEETDFSYLQHPKER